MDLVKKPKMTNDIFNDAKAAYGEGKATFIARFWDDGVDSAFVGGEPIELIEAEGWSLQHMAYSWSDKRDRGVCVTVFRRAT